MANKSIAVPTITKIDLRMSILTSVRRTKAQTDTMCLSKVGSGSAFRLLMSNFWTIISYFIPYGLVYSMTAHEACPYMICLNFSIKSALSGEITVVVDVESVTP